MGRSRTSEIKLERKEFVAFLKYFKSVSGAITGLVSGLPLAGFLWKAIVPPWPSPETNGVIIGLAVVLCVLMISFLFFCLRNSSDRLIQRLACLFLVGGLVCLGVYLASVVNFMVTVNGKTHIMGCGVTSEAEKAVSVGDVESATAKDLLDYFGHASEDRIWYGRGWATLLLLFSFLLTPALLASSFGLFVLRSFVRDKIATANSRNPAAPASSTAETRNAT
jgi:hypothetical protein